jgi:hypothetical protein
LIIVVFGISLGYFFHNGIHKVYIDIIKYKDQPPKKSSPKPSKPTSAVSETVLKEIPNNDTSKKNENSLTILVNENTNLIKKNQFLSSQIIYFKTTRAKDSNTISQLTNTISSLNQRLKANNIPNKVIPKQVNNVSVQTQDSAHSRTPEKKKK